MLLNLASRAAEQGGFYFVLQQNHDLKRLLPPSACNIQDFHSLEALQQRLVEEVGDLRPIDTLRWGKADVNAGVVNTPEGNGSPFTAPYLEQLRQIFDRLAMLRQVVADVATGD